MIFKKKLHFYSFTFSYKDKIKESTASIYIGYKKRNITKLHIKKAKEAIPIIQSAVLISVCYLGYMTEKEFKND